MRWPAILKKNNATTLRPDFPNVVFFTADARYLQLAWAAARDAAAEADRNFDVLLLVLGRPGRNLPPPAGFILHQINLPAWLQRWPVPAHMSLAAYARLFAAERWLGRWERALYLDSDVLFSGPLAPLFQLDLHGALAAMVEDCGFCRRDEAGQRSRAQLLAAIGLDPVDPYFNSGVMLFDIKSWASADVTKHLARFKDVQSGLSGSVDQDFINWATRGRVLELSPRWNFQTHFFGHGLEAVITPQILHYLDILKPWRDPEWRQVYPSTHADAFARRLAADMIFGPGPAPALRVRAHPDAVFAAHVANLRCERQNLHSRILAQLISSIGRYADLSGAEKSSWPQALAAL